ncbi:MAG: hypothetical protein HPY45_06155 [Anaerolineae bacterium]|nr:hypothetical protein [Anaerolineae bacterium]
MKIFSWRMASIVAVSLACTLSCNAPSNLQSWAKPIAVQIILKPRQVQAYSYTATASLTPFQPLPSTTATPTTTLTPTSSATPTPTSTPTSTPTFTPTLTPTPSETPLPSATLPPPPVEETIPESAQIPGVTGHAQISTLDCEARSAVDLAAFFGISIDETEFLNKLPRSDDPESGFVGNYWDARGQLPPNSYGVHAPPVAALLREYGLNAWERKGMTYQELQKEIASGQPVIVWVIGNTVPGAAVSYTSSNGNTTLVAAFEHTAIVTGYDPSFITLVDGAMTYKRSVDAFLDSWRVLNYMAVVIE